MIYVNKIGNRSKFKIIAGFYLELLMLETIKLLGSTKCKITKYENGENVPHIKVTEVILVHCNSVNNHYQQNSRLLYTFLSNNPFGKLLTHELYFFKTFNWEFSNI